MSVPVAIHQAVRARAQGCNLTIEVAVLLTLYVALTAAHPDSAWKTLRH